MLSHKYRLSKKRTEKKNSLMLHAYKINFSIGDKKFNFGVKPPELFINTLKKSI